MRILIVEDEELAVKMIRKTVSEVDANADVVGITDSILATTN